MTGVVAADIATTSWYHTIELPGGAVTPGFYDLRTVRPKIPLPRLDGCRCLDVGSATGFWAFEMERLGADVVSLDLEDPAKEDVPGARDDLRSGPAGVCLRGFEIARAHLGSAVERVDGSVYDLEPSWLGEFDFVFVGNLLLHLRDPIGALQAVRSVCRGELLSFEVVSPLLSLLVPGRAVYGMWALDLRQWWIPSMAGHRRMVEAAGFRVLRHGGPVRQRFGAGFSRTPLLQARSLRQLRLVLNEQRFGVTSQWVLATPT